MKPVPAVKFRSSSVYCIVVISLLMAGCSDSEQDATEVMDAGEQAIVEQVQEPAEEAAENSPPPIGNFPQLRQAALAAMNAEGINRLQILGAGWEACLGQPWNIAEGWARWEVQQYSRVINYITGLSYQTAQRRAGLDPEKLGGCGAQPDAAFQNQASSISADSSWEEKLQLWLTPLGFLQLAAENDPVVSQGTDNLWLSFGVEQYYFRGRYSEDLLLQEISTWIDDPVMGDMEFSVAFDNYQDFSGLLYPARVIQQQGGYTTLDLAIDQVIPNTTASAVPPPSEGGRFGGGPGSNGSQSPFVSIGPGIYVSHGAYQGVIVEKESYLVVIDGMQNDNRTREIIAQAKAISPGKPIAYVITTHLHFDHLSGLRQFAEADATIVTSAMNEAFLRDALSRSRTLNDSETDNGFPNVSIAAVDEKMTLYESDINEADRIEVYWLKGSLHADDMLVVYLPTIKTIVEADLLQPWINPVFGGGREGPHPYLTYLYQALEETGLEYEQFVPVHRPSPAPLMSKEDLLQAVNQ